MHAFTGAFQAFCKQKQYYNNNTVTEEKLFLYFVEEITGWPLKAKSYKTNNNMP